MAKGTMTSMAPRPPKPKPKGGKSGGKGGGKC